MLLTDAERLFDRFLAPVTTREFLARLADGGWWALPASAAPERRGLLGSDPAQTLTGATAIAPELTFHSDNATGPAPALRHVESAADFRRLVEAFHTRHYSVRFPGLRPYAPALDTLCRAFEALLHKPVTASAFWSAAGMQAPVHADDRDLLVVQLVGRKRWFVASAPAGLENAWDRIPGTPWALGEHTRLEVAPGDLIYLPRGTVHAVDGEDTSIHVAIGFTPLTVREALIACIDHLSDLERGWRTTVAPFLGQQMASGRLDALPDVLRRAHQHLEAALANPAFVGAALQRRSSRAVRQLSPTPVPPTGAVTPATRLRQRPDAFCHLSANEEKMDVAYPGGHLYIHRGAEAAVVFMARTAEFRVSDIPGCADDDVRVSLATRFCEAGILEEVRS